MPSHTRHILLITLFAATQLVLLPLMSSVWGQMEADCIASCCCCAPEAGPSSACGCCSRRSEDESKPDETEPESLGTTCDCKVKPPVPLLQYPSEPVLAKRRGLNALQCIDESPILSSVWPDLAARARNPPPRAKKKAASVFTQSYLI
ncbi:MAG: hypothetical protein ACI835_004524 [Planctomycetota bacterium]|jgi:hypothetical protein